jgi:hypothetical protein
MSAASTPAPRLPGTSGPRGHSLFWPILIFFIGSGSLALYQVLALEDRLDTVTRAIDQMDTQVKHSQYERTKFLSLAASVIALAPKDPYARQIVSDLGLQRLQATQDSMLDTSLMPSSSSSSTNVVLPTTNAPAAATAANPSSATH